MSNLSYTKAIELLTTCSTENGFVACASNISNYKRIWARDGIITGLAALASGNEQLILTFEKTLETLSINQHEIGTIPSNVATSEVENDVSYGGLAGRVDAVSWFVIGVCQFAFYKNNSSFVDKYKINIEKCLLLMNSWEFNNKHLMYVPLSGNWADEYITDGYTLYDQLLRIWALKSYNYFAKNEDLDFKINAIINQVEINFTPNSFENKYHQKAYDQVIFNDFMPCSFGPNGYKTQFDAFANALAIILNIGNQDFQNQIINYFENFQQDTNLKLIPAFWPPIKETDLDWHLLKNNCKYSFRNFPYEFHNGGTWSMVNGFVGLAMLKKDKKNNALQLLESINEINAIEDYSFYENFNTQTSKPNGVNFCAWSAAATIILHQNIHSNFKFLV